MIIDQESKRIGPEPRPGFLQPPAAVLAAWILSFIALVVGVAAAAAFALWVALVLIPLGILVSGLASIVYRFQLARFRRQRQSGLPAHPER